MTSKIFTGNLPLVYQIQEIIGHATVDDRLRTVRMRVTDLLQSSIGRVPEHFGYTGDDPSTDDDALRAWAAAGGLLSLMPNKTYVLTSGSPLEIQSGSVVNFNGSKLKFKKTVTGKPIRIAYKEHVVIWMPRLEFDRSDITFYEFLNDYVVNNGANTLPYYKGGITVANSSHVDIFYGEFVDLCDIGIVVGEDASVSPFVAGRCDYVRIVGNTFRNCWYGPTINVFPKVASEGNVLADNVAIDCGWYDNGVFKWNNCEITSSGNRIYRARGIGWGDGVGNRAAVHDNYTEDCMAQHIGYTFGDWQGAFGTIVPTLESLTDRDNTCVETTWCAVIEDTVCAQQIKETPGYLNLNGSLVSGGKATMPTRLSLIIATENDNSSVQISITGTLWDESSPRTVVTTLPVQGDPPNPAKKLVLLQNVAGLEWREITSISLSAGITGWIRIGTTPTYAGEAAITINSSGYGMTNHPESYVMQRSKMLMRSRSFLSLRAMQEIKKFRIVDPDWKYAGPPRPYGAIVVDDLAGSAPRDFEFIGGHIDVEAAQSPYSNISIYGPSSRIIGTELIGFGFLPIRVFPGANNSALVSGVRAVRCNQWDETSNLHLFSALVGTNATYECTINVIGNTISNEGDGRLGAWCYSTDASKRPVFRIGGNNSDDDSIKAGANLLETIRPLRMQRVGNANATINPGTEMLQITATLTSPRTYTLPPAINSDPSRPLVVVDVGGYVSATNYARIQRSGTDTVNGTTHIDLTIARGRVTLTNDGASAWTTYPLDSVTTGTSGHVLGFLDGNNTHSGNNTFSGTTTVSNTTDATDFNTGALRVSGGTSINKTLYVEKMRVKTTPVLPEAAYWGWGYGNALRITYDSAPYIGITLGTFSGSGSPFVGFNAEHGASVNTLRNMGGGVVRGSAFVRTVTDLEYRVNSVATANADFTSVSTVVSFGESGIRLPGEASIASATTTNLGSVAETRVLVTGTTTILSFGSQPNLIKIVRFADALVLTHNATTMVLPGNANITTAAGDIAAFVSDASGNWRCIWYQRAALGPRLAPRVSTYSSSGSHAVHPNATHLWIYCVAGGGGGGSGASGDNTANRGGGGGGGAGGRASAWFRTTDLATTLGVTVGVGGNGGTGVTGNTNGNNGNPGSASLVSSSSVTIVAAGGAGGGTGGQSGSGGTGGNGGTGLPTAANAGGNGGTSGAGASGLSATHREAPGGGGGGAAVTTADATFNGGTGGTGSSNLTAATGGAGGTAPGGAGGAGSAKARERCSGGGGGGGASGLTENGGAGGNGGFPGGGGGGGGATRNAYTSGAGGRGGDGEITIIEFFS
jgi:hypothetical protein